MDYSVAETTSGMDLAAKTAETQGSIKLEILPTNMTPTQVGRK
jgi:hypothetical protein